MDRTLGTAVAVVGGLALALASAIPGDDFGPRLLPLVAGAALCAAGVAIARQGGSTSPAQGPTDATETRERPDSPDSEHTSRSVALAMLGIAYVTGIDQLGYLLSTAVVVPGVYALFGERRPIRLLIVALAVPLALHTVFFRLLGVFPPLGQRFDLLDHLPL